MVRSLAFLAAFIGTPVWAACPAEPQSNFDISKPGLVKDTETGLTWMRCSMGSEWENSACAGVPSRYEWKRGKQAVDEMNTEGGFGGYKDWRLPTLAELKTLINKQCFHPAIDSNTFADIQPTGYWASDMSKAFPEAASIVHFYHGEDYITSKTKTWYVRAVRK